MHVVKDLVYCCKKDDESYSLCQSCIDNNPSYFKGTILKDIKELSIADRAKLAADGVVDILNIAAEVNELGKNITELKEAAGQFLNDLFGD